MEKATRDTHHVSLDYELTALLDTVPDTFGLKSWHVATHIPWNKYKLIWLHLNPREMIPYWYEYPKMIKRLAPEVPMIISHEYAEKYHDEPIPFVLKEAFNHADFMHVHSAEAICAWQKVLDIPVKNVPIGQPRRDELPWPRALPWNKRDGVVILEHSVPTDMVSMMEALKLVKDGYGDFPVTLLTANPTRKKEYWNSYIWGYNLSATGYERLPFDQYMDRIRHAKVAVDFGYVGISRFSYECAKVNVPVIGNENQIYRNMLWPDLTVTDVGSMSEWIVSLLHDKKLYDVTKRYAQGIVKNYFSKEACMERFKYLLRDIGYEGELIAESSESSDSGVGRKVLDSKTTD